MAMNQKLPSGSGVGYRGGYLDTENYNPEKMFDVRTKDGPWIMQINPGSGSHYIIVDKMEGGVVNVFDPWRLESPGIGNGLEATTTKGKLLKQWEQGGYAFVFPVHINE